MVEIDILGLETERRWLAARRGPKVLVWKWWCHDWLDLVVLESERMGKFLTAREQYGTTRNRESR